MDLESHERLVVYACEPQGRPPKPGQTRRRFVFEEQLEFTLRGFKRPLLFALAYIYFLFTVNAQMAQIGAWATLDHAIYAQNGYGKITHAIAEERFGGRISKDLSLRVRVVLDLGNYRRMVSAQNNVNGNAITTNYMLQSTLLELGCSVKLLQESKWEPRWLVAGALAMPSSTLASAHDTSGQVIWRSENSGRNVIGLRTGLRSSHVLVNSLSLIGEGSFLLVLRDGLNYEPGQFYSAQPNIPRTIGSVSLKMGLEYEF